MLIEMDELGLGRAAGDVHRLGHVCDGLRTPVELTTPRAFKERTFSKMRNEPLCRKDPGGYWGHATYPPGLLRSESTRAVVTPLLRGKHIRLPRQIPCTPVPFFRDTA